MSFQLVLAEHDKVDSVLEDFLTNANYRDFAFRDVPTAESLRQRLFINKGFFPVLARDKASGDKLVLLGLVLDDGPPYFEFVELKADLNVDLLRRILGKFLYLLFKTRNLPRLLYYVDARDEATLQAFVAAGFEHVQSDNPEEIPLLIERQAFIEQYVAAGT